MRKLRVHHLLCSALYAGKGYSEEFCENMHRIVQWLWEDTPEEREKKSVELTDGPDGVCQKCPNLTADGCSLDDNNVVSKDMRLAKRLGLEPGKIYTVSALLSQVSENLTEEIFETSCRNCEWYQMGLCHYENLIAKYLS